MIYGTIYLSMGQIKYFKGWLSQILLSPFLNALSHVIITYLSSRFSFGPLPRNHSFGTFPKFSEKLTFLTLPPLYQFSFPSLFLCFYLLISIYNRQELCIFEQEITWLFFNWNNILKGGGFAFISRINYYWRRSSCFPDYRSNVKIARYYFGTVHNLLTKIHAAVVGGLQEFLMHSKLFFFFSNFSRLKSSILHVW